MRKALEDSGALAYSEDQSRKHTTLALEAIESLAENNFALQQMIELASSLVDRQM
jgi:geranylgeranyl pyrophosphate synthase